MLYESSELQEIKDSVTKCANILWPPSKHLWVHVKDGNWTGWITDVNLYISPILPHSAVLILLLALAILDRKTVITLDFLIPRMPIPQIWHHNDPSPHPILAWSMLFSCQQNWSSGLASTSLFWEMVGVFCNSCCLRHFYFESRHGNVPFSEHFYPNIARIAKMQLSG